MAARHSDEDAEPSRLGDVVVALRRRGRGRNRHTRSLSCVSKKSARLNATSLVRTDSDPRSSRDAWEDRPTRSGAAAEIAVSRSQMGGFRGDRFSGSIGSTRLNCVHERPRPVQGAPRGAPHGLSKNAHYRRVEVAVILAAGIGSSSRLHRSLAIVTWNSLRERGPGPARVSG